MEKVDKLIQMLSSETGAPETEIKKVVEEFWGEKKKTTEEAEESFLEEVKMKFLHQIMICGTADYSEYYYITSVKLDAKHSMVEFSGTAVNIYTHGVSITSGIKRRGYKELDKIPFASKDMVKALFNRKVMEMSNTLQLLNQTL